MRRLLGSTVGTGVLTALATMRTALVAVVILIAVVVLLALLSDTVNRRLRLLVITIKARPTQAPTDDEPGDADRGPRAA